MKLVKIEAHAKHTAKVEALFNKSCKIEAKWKRLEKRFLVKAEAGYTEPPTTTMDRLMRQLHSIKNQLVFLGFDTQ